MSEQLRESLSATIDGEADEFELRRVLDEIARDDDLAGRWSRYQLVSGVLRGDGLSMSTSQDLWRRIDAEPAPSDAMAEDLDIEQDLPPKRGGFFSVIVGGAVAAGVAAVVVMTFGTAEDTPVTEIADNAPPVQSTPVEAFGFPNDVDVRRANAYMIQHSQHVSMKNRAAIPFVKLVTHNPISAAERATVRDGTEPVRQ